MMSIQHPGWSQGKSFPSEASDLSELLNLYKEKLPNISCQLYQLPWLDRKFKKKLGGIYGCSHGLENNPFAHPVPPRFRSSKSSLWKLSWNITRMAGGERISLCHHTTSPPTNSSVVCSNSQIKIWFHQWLWCPGKRKEAHMMPPYMRGNRLMDFMAWKCCKRLNLGDALRIAIGHTCYMHSLSLHRHL